MPQKSSLKLGFRKSGCHPARRLLLAPSLSCPVVGVAIMGRPTWPGAEVSSEDLRPCIAKCMILEEGPPHSGLALEMMDAPDNTLIIVL